MKDAYLEADWPAPERVRTLLTTRCGGMSAGPYASNNLGDHVGDDPARVATNRERLMAIARSAETIHWIRQVHGTRVVGASETTLLAEADGCFTRQVGLACAVLTADCLPVLICDRHGAEVAAVHAGWRGLAAGILPAAIRRFSVKPDQLLVYLGPAISRDHFQVGGEVREAFLASSGELGADYRRSLESCFMAADDGAFQADLYAIARLQCAALGVTAVYGGSHCTYREEELFYSFRRDGQTGRMASLIWLAA